ncbi:MAG: fibronectin type III domain-containing protein [Clostridia bacterium]|nr:fibronectin type III domain-containing protein [Clostridia bacterium]
MSKTVKLLFFAAFMLIFSVFEANAGCVHDFEKADSGWNIFCVSESSHAYYCLKKCGKYGTPSDGINTEEKCVYCTVSVKEPDCISGGKTIYMCTVCKRSKEVITPVGEHRYKRIRKLPTCTEKGYDIVYCTQCDKSYKENFTETLKHFSDGGVIEIQPTFSRGGILKFSCRVCGCVLERKSIPELIKVSKKNKTTEKVSGLKVKSYGTTFVKLGWDKSSDAVSYKVFYSTDKNKWKTIISDKNYISVKNLDASGKYYFKIAAVGKNGQGEASKTVTAYTKPQKTKIENIVSSKKSRVTLRWKKIKNVSGYEVSYSEYRFDKNKGIKSVAVTEGRKLSLSKLKSGKKYYFRVRAYKKFSNVKIYGAFSNVKALKIR